jgi:hypothetical protein
MDGIVFSHDGTSGFGGIWSTITAARSFSGILLDIPPYGATHWIRYTGGATAALKIGEILTGNTSTKTCHLLGRAIENGVAAGNSDAGILIVNQVSGAFLGDTTLTGVSTGTVTINAAQEFISLLAYQQPKAALITVETASINFTLNGSVPTVTAGTNFGLTMTAGQSYVIRGAVNVRKFACINSIAASGAIMKYELFF